MDKEKALKIIERLKVVYPDVKSALHFADPFELLIATILSAQTKELTRLLIDFLKN